MPASVFSRLAHRIAAIEGERYPLHVGDTWMEPPVGARMENLTVADHPGLHRYPPPTGHPPLIRALAEHRGIEADRILVTLGATGAWHAVAGTTLEPGEEVLVLAPYWPLFPGIVRSVGGRPIDVPFYDTDAFVPGTDRSAIPTPEQAVAIVEAHITPRTVALYVNSPSNPTGVVLPPAVLKALAELARAHDLWIWSDEVYELYSYGPEVVPISTFAPERTFSAFSFSKAHGLAGCRVGYVVAPERVGMRDELRKMAMHASYSAPLPSQLAARAILDPTIGPPWVARARAAYQQAGNAAADRLKLPRPEGGTFLFVDVSRGLRSADEDPLHAFLVRCIERGLVLAPGVSSGHPYTRHVRLCFTSADPEVVGRGVDVLADLLDL
jgi:N-succinyldiaminopimelate aminotransferase